MKYLTVGPIQLTPAVQEALGVPPTPSRTGSFRERLEALRAQLRALFEADDVHVLLGSGTLANDAVAAQLQAVAGRGMVLVNGEFGNRLHRHAAAWGLDHEVWRVPWGEPFDLDALRSRMTERPRSAGQSISWLWAAHCETSTGMLNSLAGLKRLASDLDAHLCLDCVSSLGNVRTSLRGVYLASGSSGKGLAASPGLALVFLSGEVRPFDGPIPRYLDLRIYEEAGGLPFTQCTPLVDGLQVSLNERYGSGDPMSRPGRLTRLLREGLRDLGVFPIVEEGHACPGIVTLDIPEGLKAARVAEALAARGYFVSATSGYLRQRNWLQVGVMGSALESSDVEGFVAAFGDVLADLDLPRA